MLTLFKKISHLNLFTHLDVQFATEFAKEDEDLLLLIFALLSYKIRKGDSCLLLDKLNPLYFFEGKNLKIAVMLWKFIGSPDLNQILFKLERCNAICKNESKKKPLILIKNKLYFQKILIIEKKIADFLSNHTLNKINEKKLKTILNSLFPKNGNIENLQKIAIAISITSKISIISGGPGTGKTTIIAYLLIILFQLNKKTIIKLATPTGKAAARLTESLNQTLFKLDNNLKKKITSIQANTIHRLLGIKKNDFSSYYNKDNPIPLDILIIDEASMIDFFMMNKIIESIPKNSQVILLGDQNQLPPIGIGCIFKDICYFLKHKYSKKRIEQLTKITECKLSNHQNYPISKFKNRMCYLKKNYRFSNTSAIGKISSLIHQNNIVHIKKLLKEKNTNLIFHTLDLSKKKYEKLLLEITSFYKNYFNMINFSKNYEKILETFNSYRLLTALKNGPYGSIILNKKIEYLLFCNDKIKFEKNTLNGNYVGRPIIIIENDWDLHLFNGDIGIILKDKKGNLKSFFKFPDGSIKNFKIHLLPKHKTAFVMTVHKSQGSEFKSIILILPPIFLQNIMNKQLIYTAITRARKTITIYSNKKIFFETINTTSNRYSGLIERLLSKN